MLFHDEKIGKCHGHARLVYGLPGLIRPHNNITARSERARLWHDGLLLEVPDLVPGTWPSSHGRSPLQRLERAKPGAPDAEENPLGVHLALCRFPWLLSLLQLLFLAALKGCLHGPWPFDGDRTRVGRDGS